MGNEEKISNSIYLTIRDQNKKKTHKLLEWYLSDDWQCVNLIFCNAITRPQNWIGEINEAQPTLLIRKLSGRFLLTAESECSNVSYD